VPLAAAVPRLEFNFTPQQLFASKKRNFDELREAVASKFGREDNLIMVLISAPDVWTPETLTYTHRLTNTLRGWDELKHVDSLTTLELPRAGGESLTTRPLVIEALEAAGQDPDAQTATVDAATTARLKEAVAGEPLVEGRLVSKKGDMLAVVMWMRDDIEQAVLMLLEVEKTVVEGAGAAGLAALLRHPAPFHGRHVGLVLCGGNIDPLLLAAILERGMVRAGRLARIRVSARDVPGSLAHITATVAEAGANIDEVHHQRAFSLQALQNVDIELVVQTRGRAHLAEVLQALRQAGFEAV
jgi:hypothetical protein